MTTEDKALALLNEVMIDQGLGSGKRIFSDGPAEKALREALCRSIEQHEATKQEFDDFKQKVSDVVHHYVHVDGGPNDWEKLITLIIPAPKPDPLQEAAKMMGYFNTAANAWAEDVRASLDALGFEIREKNYD